MIHVSLYNIHVYEILTVHCNRWEVINGWCPWRLEIYHSLESNLHYCPYITCLTSWKKVNRWFKKYRITSYRCFTLGIFLIFIWNVCKLQGHILEYSNSHTINWTQPRTCKRKKLQWSEKRLRSKMGSVIKMFHLLIFWS